MSGIDYGPLAGLIGTWKGDRGRDMAPEADGIEENLYYETLTFIAAGEVDNAETQELVSIHYHQLVKRIADDKAIHNQTGYWIWDAAAKTIMHSFTIPRGVCVIAGGTHQGELNESGDITLTEAAAVDDSDWQIIQAPFMQGNARTTDFKQTIKFDDRYLSYSQSTVVEIYGKCFDHTDENQLTRV